VPNPLQVAGAQLSPSDFAPLHVNRMTTGLWPNTNPLRDAGTAEYVEKFYGGRQDSLYGGINTEISTRLTLIRRPGCIIYNSQTFPPINRYYGWNTFTLTDEAVRVMVDTGMGGGIVYDGTGPNTKQIIFTKSPGAGTTYFLGVGNTLYFTNGVDNKQLDNATGEVTNWGIDAPANAPVATQQPRPNPYPSWAASTVHAYFINITPAGAPVQSFTCNVVIVDENNNLQVFGFLGGPSDGTIVKSGFLGTSEPPVWAVAEGASTADGTIEWFNWGTASWLGAAGRSPGEVCVAAIANPPGTPDQMFVCIKGGNTASPDVEPNWPIGLGQQVAEGDAIWQNAGPALKWADIGTTTSITGVGNAITTAPTIVDPNGFLETVYRQGLSGSSPPTIWVNQPGGLTADGVTLIWQNGGPYAVPGQFPIQYGYAFATTNAQGQFIDLSNMSPVSNPITVIQGNEVQVQGDGSPQPDPDTVVIYRTAQDGFTFLYLDQIPMPAPGVKWTYIDNKTDSQLNTEIQAQVNGEGTPLPPGATCLAYHIGRIFAAVGNVVYVSSGPDAVVSGSSGNAGFDITRTCQSKIIKFWVNALGVVVFTLKDAYLIQGDGTINPANGVVNLSMATWIEDLPLLHYDAFTVLLSTGYLYGGQRMVTTLDPSAGIVDASFPIDNIINSLDPKAAFCTYHTGGSGETALYVSDGASYWYRFSATSAPETGFNWSPKALITGGMSALQSTEILPGTKALLIGPPATGGPIRMRDTTVNSDNGIPYIATADYNPIVLAVPGQLAGIAWMTLKTMPTGNTPTLGVILDEISGPYETVPRTRQDPPNLPPSISILSDRYSLLQGQKPVWCQYLKFGIQWPAKDSPDELLSYTIFGQTWAEQRSQ
jgi:hypothetical protein